MELKHFLKYVLSHSTIPVVVSVFPVTVAEVVHKGAKADTWEGEYLEKAGSIYWARD